MKTIGILGGLGPESTSEYYNEITRTYYRRFGDYDYPEILIHSLNFQKYIDAGYRLIDDLTKAIRGLYTAGADFVISACNSVHVVYEEVSKDIPIPWISIMDAIGERIRENNIRRVALLGTVFTMGGDFYPKAFKKYKIELMLPDNSAQQRVNRIIYEELVTHDLRDDSRRYVQGLIEELGHNGAEGVVLGCTELPFLLRPEDVSLPVFDSTVIHAHKALDLALADRM